MLFHDLTIGLGQDFLRIVIMKWSDVTFDWAMHKSYDENKKAEFGYLLQLMGVDLNKLPDCLFEEFSYYDKNKRTFTDYTPQKVNIADVIGSTSYDYTKNGNLIAAYLNIPRLALGNGESQYEKEKYFDMMKSDIFILSENRLQEKNTFGLDDPIPAIDLIKTKDGFYVDGTGNKRIIIYKLMYITDCIMAHFGYNEHPWPLMQWDMTDENGKDLDQYDKEACFWLNAFVREEKK